MNLAEWAVVGRCVWSGSVKSSVRSGVCQMVFAHSRRNLLRSDQPHATRPQAAGPLLHPLSHHSIVMILTEAGCDADTGEQTSLFCCFPLPSIFLPQVTHMKMSLITTLSSVAESAHMLMCLLIRLRGRLSGLACDDTWRCSSNLRFSLFTWLQAEFIVIFLSAVSFTMSLINIKWNLTLITYCDVLLS